ncbi:putative Beta-lactamase [Xenorhabdus poinarii G6]|uniref:Putative Beta-lactamase n=1 Tax=Xenorhabdus poinarii G6 TaxID=1354304 RepID=A0A068R6W3_9GAMM|nr:tetratricopeptide repeat protein [Xenorhabdus poinarii]CDG22958.1 putative Beta-lactamase [Xenorhabdus poinarii G6]
MRKKFSIIILPIITLLTSCVDNINYKNLNEDELIRTAVKLDHEDENYHEAFKYYLLAAEKGNAVALNNLGYLYEQGLGVKQNYTKALDYYNKAIRSENPKTALHNLSRLYLDGLGVEKNKEKALELLKKSADLGNNQAMSDLYWLTNPKSKNEYN